MVILLSYHALIGVTLGFEKISFTVDEDNHFVQLCVNVFEPPVIDPNTGLPVVINDINIITRSADGTAGITAGFK